ncbi:MAG TPA: cytochrome c [Bauldia sp.]|nr:cytochrome c [Bauldia sp.]
MRAVIGVGIAALALVVAGAAFGDDDPVHARQQLMKMNNASAKAAFGMIKGTTPYDATQAAAQMNQIATDIETFVTLLPPDSANAAGTYASPDIWTNMDDFKALATKLDTDAKAAAAAAAGGVDAFKVAFAAVNSDCSACHKKYRLSDD